MQTSSLLCNDINICTTFQYFPRPLLQLNPINIDTIGTSQIVLINGVSGTRTKKIVRIIQLSTGLDCLSFTAQFRKLVHNCIFVPPLEKHVHSLFAYFYVFLLYI